MSLPIKYERRYGKAKFNNYILKLHFCFVIFYKILFKNNNIT